MSDTPSSFTFNSCCVNVAMVIPPRDGKQNAARRKKKKKNAYDDPLSKVFASTLEVRTGVIRVS